VSGGRRSARAALVAVILAAVVGTAGGGGPAAAAAGGSAHPNQRFVLVATDLGQGRLVASGPIHGVGTDTVVDHTDNPDGSSTDTDRFELPDGQVLLRDTYIFTVTTDGQSCASDISVEGTWTIVSGTGAYAGATGGGNFTAHGIFVAGREPSGGCLGFDSPPVAFSQVVRGVGTVDLA
jgi:hypothetical protein